MAENTQQELWQQADAACAESSKPAPNVANCETQTWPRRQQRVCSPMVRLAAAAAAS